LQTVADDNSVICSALHSKGLLDDFSFAVDSAFGRKLAEQEPLVLHGYHVMARPIANLMRKSNTLSRAMKLLANPWIEQMMFESGYSQEESTAGRAILVYGTRVAKAVGVMSSWIPDIVSSTFSASFVSLSIVLAFAAKKIIVR
jgi:hypothetical protein